MKFQTWILMIVAAQIEVMKLIRELTGGHVEIALHKKLSGGIVGIGASGLDAAEGGEQCQKELVFRPVGGIG
ncbi:hypothetical protein L6452_39999 [Arctium lappa]|uniref:Uncharacterized protein n=1 Tax=Arctium lappa TaxID=4217 RepID=A0ACB8XUG7_ARCLA|nr:hypothetical protein L6452_39999 [Arctium lappa]